MPFKLLFYLINSAFQKTLKAAQNPPTSSSDDSNKKQGKKIKSKDVIEEDKPEAKKA